MPLSTAIANATTRVFATTQYFGETITLYTGGDTSNNYDASTTFVGVVDRDEEAGIERTNEIAGDGRKLEQKHGRRIRHSTRIECASTVDLDDTRDPVDRVKIADGSFWALKRIIERDTDMMVALFVRSTPVRQARSTREG